MQVNNGYGYFLLGVGVGAAVGLLFAPKSGVDTRNYLQSKAEETAQQLKEQTGQALNRAADTIDRGKTMLRDQADNLSKAIDSGKRAYKQTVESTVQA
jgi:gas vesicle protein